MSIKVVEHILETSPHRGSELILLIVLGTYVNDEGRGAYPLVDTLAKKCRLTRRATGYALAAVVESGAVSVEVGKGPKGTNRYAVNLGKIAIPTEPVEGRRRGKKLPHETECMETGFISHETGCMPQVVPPMQSDAPTPCNLVQGAMQPGTGDSLYIDPVKDPVKEDPSPLTPQGGERTSAQKRWTQDDQGRFDQFWKLYPAKKAKKVALTWWKRHRPSGDLFAAIMTGLRVQLASDEGFASGITPPCPHPPSWLNAERWADAVEPPRRGDMFDPDSYPRLLTVENVPETQRAAPSNAKPPIRPRDTAETQMAASQGFSEPDRLAGMGILPEYQARYHRILGECKLLVDLRNTYFVPADQGTPPAIIFESARQRAAWSKSDWTKRGALEGKLRNEYGHKVGISVVYLDFDQFSQPGVAD